MKFAARCNSEPLSYEDARAPCSPASAPRRRPVCVVRAARRFQERLLPVLGFFRALLAVFCDSAFAPCRASCANGIVRPPAPLARSHICGMVRGADCLVFVVAEDATFELTRDRHSVPPFGSRSSRKKED